MLDYGKKKRICTQHTGWGPFDMNYCSSNSGLQLFCIFGSGVSHPTLHNTPLARQFCSPILHRDTMVHKPGVGIIVSVGKFCWKIKSASP